MILATDPAAIAPGKRRALIHAADLFCGAGGTSTGLHEAADELGMRMNLTAVNHWPRAIETHTANHPTARHYCATLDAINPRELYAEDELDILWASPECTHHSIARGGKPINDQSRSTAWCVVRWAEALRPKVILVENVKEFLTWGPVCASGKKMKKKQGAIFTAWVQALEACGYRVEWKILCAADYGDPTTRRRLFVYAVRGRRKIIWPEPTHAPREEADLFTARKPWVPARDIIDWSHKGKSIYSRKKPLAEKTMRRIMIGLEKFGLAPFIVPQHQGGRPVHPVADPLPVVTTSGAHALAQPFLIQLRGTSTTADLDQPAPTVTAGGGHLGLVEPYLIEVAHGNGDDQNGDARRAKTLNDPLNTVPCSNRFGLCQPFVVGIDHGSSDHVRSIGEPVSAVTTKQRHAVAQPYLIKFYGTGEASSIGEPLDTVTTKDRYGLCQPVLEIDGERYLVDILFRMLRPGELAQAQGFPKNYQFTGTTTEIVKQIGNAVPKNLAKALGKSALAIV